MIILRQKEYTSDDFGYLFLDKKGNVCKGVKGKIKLPTRFDLQRNSDTGTIALITRPKIDEIRNRIMHSEKTKFPKPTIIKNSKK